jgi:hypothetical protein
MDLFDALYSLGFVLIDFSRGVSSAAGSTTTLVDTDNRFEGEDFFDNGTLFITSGALASTSLPVSDWNGTTKTFTFPTQGSAPGAGAIYAAIPKDYPRELMVESINQALVSIGELPTINTVPTIGYQEEYVLPAGVFDVKMVEVSNSLVDPYLYVPNYNWHEREGKLVFDTGYEPKVDGYKVRFSYNEAHAAVNDDSDSIDDLIHPDLLKWAAAVEAFRWRFKRNPEAVGASLNEALLNFEREKRKHKIPRFKKTPHLSRWF